MLNSLPASVVCYIRLQTVWTQIRLDKMPGLICVQTKTLMVFLKEFLGKKSTEDKGVCKITKHAKN